MAEFCQQCSIEIFGEDLGDFKGLAKTGFYVVVLCEGCGPAQVDPNGRCVSSDCLEKHAQHYSGHLTR